MGTNAGLSACCQIKKEINEPEDLRRHKRFLLKQIQHATQSDDPCLLSVAFRVFGSAVAQKPRRSRRRKHVISHADGQTGLSVLQTCFIERDATIGWAETVVKTKTLKKTLPIPDPIRSEPAGQDRGVPIIVCFNGSNTSGWAQLVIGTAQTKRTHISYESDLNGTMIQQLSENCIYEDFETINPKLR